MSPRALRSAHRLRRAIPAPAGATDRAAAVATTAQELREWREAAVPDPETPLDATDIARLVVDCFATVGIDPSVGAALSVNTVHYYRRRDVIDPPAGRTSAARYEVRHLWQVAAARLAGQLALVTLDEARLAIQRRDEPALIDYLAARIVDARGRAAAHRRPDAEVTPVAAPAAETGARTSRPLPGVASPMSAPPRIAPAHGGVAEPRPASIITLDGAACLIIPSDHAALASVAGASRLVASLARSLGLDTTSVPPDA